MSTIDLIQEVEAVDLSDYEYDFGTDNPALYVGTYHKYNCGSLFGMWLDLTKFDSLDEFYNACRYLHKDENDPEFMFQDYSGFPRCLYSECGMDESKFELIQAMADMDEDEKDAFRVYLESFGHSGSDCREIERFKDRYCGRWDSKMEYAEHFAWECGYLDEMPEHLRQYFDFDAFARDLFFDYYFDEETGFVFSQQ